MINKNWGWNLAKTEGVQSNYLFFCRCRYSANDHPVVYRGLWRQICQVTLLASGQKLHVDPFMGLI